MSYCNNEREHYNEGKQDYQRYGRDYNRPSEYECQNAYDNGYNRARRDERERREMQEYQEAQEYYYHCQQQECDRQRELEFQHYIDQQYLEYLCTEQSNETIFLPQ